MQSYTFRLKAAIDWQTFYNFTDHQNLQELFNSAKTLELRSYTVMVCLQRFEFTAKYTAGRNNIMADCMSRDVLNHITHKQLQTKQVNTKMFHTLHHLCTSGYYQYISSSDKILCTMDHDEVTSDSEDEELAEMPSLNATRNLQ